MRRHARRARQVAAGRRVRHLLRPGRDGHLGRLPPRKALEEERALLSGDGGFLERSPVTDGSVTFLQVPQLPVEEQLRMVVNHFGLARSFSRCMKCNGGLEVVSSGAVAGRAPGGVAAEYEEFFLCAGCGRIFWHGSHWNRIGGRLDRVFG